MKRVFLDTNVALDYVLERFPFVDDAEEIFAMAAGGEISLLMSAMSFPNMAYIARKQYPGKTIYDVLEQLRLMVEPVPISVEALDNALLSQANDFEDALQYFSALSAGADCIVTRNVKDFPFATIPVMLPAEFLDMMESHS